MEKEINFSLKAKYATYGELSDKTEKIWFVCHGYGQLAEFFIKNFEVLDPNTNYVIAPQGLSKFYLKGFTGRVGATWMTKEDRETDMQNQRSYFEAVLAESFQGKSLNNYKVHLMGFSHGVSMISRMAAYSKIEFKTLVLWAGGFPPELEQSDFDHIRNDAKLKIVIGDNDEFYPLEKFQRFEKKLDEYLPNFQSLKYKAKHEITNEMRENMREWLEMKR